MIMSIADKSAQISHTGPFNVVYEFVSLKTRDKTTYHVTLWRSFYKAETVFPVFF